MRQKQAAANARKAEAEAATKTAASKLVKQKLDAGPIIQKVDSGRQTR